MRGWKNFRRIASRGAAALLLCGTALAVERAADTALAAEFLEFLADWDNEQGEWQDPIEYEDPHWQALDEEAGQSDE